MSPIMGQLYNDEVTKDADVIMAASGHQPKFSIVPDLVHAGTDPTVPPLPDLYQNVIAVDYSDSLVCTSYCVVNDDAMSYRELQLMTIV
ncbi:dimethylaniline monooxygenase 2 [Colletotrichum tofieldiae]|nr:dimethylaniline monooxygenase 2 [Colletotrichum tofieldiae]GKT70296.1 dimethylaniline monooxygenase 2 [Colletotrichum tofieldiae]GKT93353.1 dimethylaniline monooxygenase 2 [Colletotrichum tofieldiae]